MVQEMGLPWLNYTGHSLCPRSRNRVQSHWDGGSPSTLKAGACKQEIREGGSWVNN